MTVIIHTRFKNKMWIWEIETAFGSLHSASDFETEVVALSNANRMWTELRQAATLIYLGSEN